MPPSLDSILEHLLDMRYFHGEDGESPVIPLHYAPGKVPLFVVVGPNAGGKSFLRRLVQAVCRKQTPRVECMAVSMEFRTESGNPARAFVFGAEDWESTGQISGRTITSGIKTCHDRKIEHVVFWDEPDLGLSDGYAAGAGRTLAAFAKSMPEKTLAAFVVTHSKALLRQLVDAEPHYMHVGDEDPPKTLRAWLDTEAPVLSIEELSEASITRFRRIQKIIDKKKKAL